jgi:hypothetical protein
VNRVVGHGLSRHTIHHFSRAPLACENRYRTTLREKAALVVVDDIWNLEHLQPLLVDVLAIIRKRILLNLGYAHPSR